MSSRFVVEMGGRVVGLALRVQGGYRFFASDDGFRAFEGRIFPRARALLHAIRGGDKPSGEDGSDKGGDVGGGYGLTPILRS